MMVKLNPDELARLLTRNTQQLDDKTLSALQHARQTALSRQSSSSPALALSTGRWSISYGIYPWLAAALLIGILFSGISYWHHQNERHINQLDVAILTDDLPIEVFID
jgi:hypothetical protein